MSTVLLTTLSSIIYKDKTDPGLAAYWTEMGSDLFHNMKHLYNQIETSYAGREPEDIPGAPMTVGMTSWTVERSEIIWADNGAYRHSACIPVGF